MSFRGLMMKRPGGAVAIVKDEPINDSAPEMIVLEGAAELNQTGNSTESAYKTVYILEGIGCASCASQMESEIKRLAGVSYASVDFATKKLALETDGQVSIPKVYEKIVSIVKRIEPGVEVVSADAARYGKEELFAHSYGEDEFSLKKQGAKLIIGGALFAAGVIFTFPAGWELTVFLLSYFIAGGSVIWRAVQGITQRQVFSENFLMTVATIGAFAIGAYSEGAAVMLFYLIGEMFQDKAVDHSRKSISALMDIRPDYANLKIGEEFKKVSPEDVACGDLIVVKPGERIPLDGKVIEGRSMVDTSALTGESVPRELEPGSEALSGFINNNGVLTIEVTKEYSESTVAKILDLVENASSRKAPTEDFITKFAAYYTPAVVFGALALAVIPPLVIEGAVFSDWIYRALIFLVISCPCALVISIPLGFFGGIGGASKRGIMVKGSNYLEALNNVEAVVFDKTGTLTKGVFKVTEIQPQNNFTQAELIEYAAYAESYSNHPIALSIAEAYDAEIDKNRIGHYEEIPGQGIKVTIDGTLVLAGNSRLMHAENIKFSEADTLGTVIHVAIGQVYAGYIVIADEIKEDAADAIKELKALGVKKTVMLTGDNKVIGDRIGQQLGLDEVYSELLPADKVDKLEVLENQKSRKGKVVFVGDGLNDAPVLARADIGMAMGGIGSDAAIEAADVVIMNDEPSSVATAIKVARRTRTIVVQNIIFALGVKAIFMALGAIGIATMWEAVFADVGVAVIAILNSIRVINTKSL